jgi:hypothetical protein
MHLHPPYYTIDYIFEHVYRAVYYLEEKVVCVDSSAGSEKNVYIK